MELTNLITLRFRLLVNMILLVSLIILVPVFFLLIQPKQLAGLYAGLSFIFLGVMLILTYKKSGQPTKFWGFYAALIHLFVISIPMLFTRALHFQLPFEEVRVLGLPGPVFHHLSEVIYMTIAVCMIRDFQYVKKMIESIKTLSIKN